MKETTAKTSTLASQQIEMGTLSHMGASAVGANLKLRIFCKMLVGSTHLLGYTYIPFLYLHLFLLTNNTICHQCFLPVLQVYFT